MSCASKASNRMRKVVNSLLSMKQLVHEILHIRSNRCLALWWLAPEAFSKKSKKVWIRDDRGSGRVYGKRWMEKRLLRGLRDRGRPARIAQQTGQVGRGRGVRRREWRLRCRSRL